MCVSTCSLSRLALGRRLAVFTIAAAADSAHRLMAVSKRVTVSAGDDEQGRWAAWDGALRRGTTQGQAVSDQTMGACLRTCACACACACACGKVGVEVARGHGRWTWEMGRWGSRKVGRWEVGVEGLVTVPPAATATRRP